MRICPQCRSQYLESDVRVCSKDGTRLMEAKQFAAAEADPLRGVVVGGRFKIIWRIGVGGMGTVYRAEQAGLDRQVALKILKKELIADRETVRRFEREAKSTSLLVHPNTVRVFDYGETSDGLLFLAMELLEGELLTQRIEGHKPMELRDAVSVARQILNSLAEAHSKGIIHRDLKPDNIFLMKVDGRADAVVKVLDFGIAKIIQGERQVDQLETQAGTVFGTPRYMSPEQAQGKPLDARSDLYAVGVLLYQMLTGRSVFTDDDAVVVMAKHIKDRPIPPRKIAPQCRIPVSLERVVMKALEKEPKNRFTNAEEFDSALANCLPDVELAMRGPTSQRPSTAAGALDSVPRSALVVSMVVLVAALGIALYVLLGKGTRPRAPVPVATVVTQDSAIADAVLPTSVRSVLLRSEPFGAQVIHEGQSLGETPLRVSLGENGTPVRVTLRAAGFNDLEAELSAADPTPLLTLAAESDAQVAVGLPVPPRRFGNSPRDGGVRPGQNANTGTSDSTNHSPGGDSTVVAPPNMDTSMQAGGTTDPYERFE